MAANNKLDEKMLRVMFNSIRSAEIKNIKTQKLDDKGMVKIIEDYVVRKVREEMKNSEN